MIPFYFHMNETKYKLFKSHHNEMMMSIVKMDKIINDIFCKN